MKQQQKNYEELNLIDMCIDREKHCYHVYGLNQDFTARDLGEYQTLQEARSVCFKYGFIAL